MPESAVPVIAFATTAPGTTVRVAMLPVGQYGGLFRSQIWYGNE